MGNRNATGNKSADLKQSAEPAAPTAPWRSFKGNGSWTLTYKEKLVSDIGGIQIKDDKIKVVNILLCGIIQSGKSAFLNSVACIDENRGAQVAGAGGGGQSRTKKEYIPTDVLKNFKLFDTMGIESRELRGFKTEDFFSVVNGNVKPGYEFDPENAIDGKEKKMFKDTPTNADKMHCVVFVIDANALGYDNLSEGAKTKLRRLSNGLNSNDIPKIILLTKIDVLCEMVDRDVTKTFESQTVKSVVDTVKDLFNVPERNIFPVQNYSREIKNDDKQDILILLALRQMVFFATDYLNKLTKK